MWVCICNAINACMVEKAIQEGCDKCIHVFQHYECMPQCGKCACSIKELIAEKKDDKTLDD